jgi:hypothetical protein
VAKKPTRAKPAIQKHVAKAKSASNGNRTDDQKTDADELLGEALLRSTTLPAEAKEFFALRNTNIKTARRMRIAMAVLCVIYSLSVVGALYYILIWHKLEALGLKDYQYAQVALIAGSLAASVAVLLVLTRGVFTSSVDDEKHPFMPEQVKALLDVLDKGKPGP